MWCGWALRGWGSRCRRWWVGEQDCLPCVRTARRARGALVDWWLNRFGLVHAFGCRRAWNVVASPLLWRARPARSWLASNTTMSSSRVGLTGAECCGASAFDAWSANEVMVTTIPTISVPSKVHLAPRTRSIRAITSSATPATAEYAKSRWNAKAPMRWLPVSCT